MFSRPRLNVIVCDEGFTVEVLGRTGIMYTEGGKRLSIDSELLLGPSGLIIYPHSIKTWDPPFEGIKITTLEKEQIIENIRRAFLFDGFEIKIYPYPYP